MLSPSESHVEVNDPTQDLCDDSGTSVAVVRKTMGADEDSDDDGLRRRSDELIPG